MVVSLSVVFSLGLVPFTMWRCSPWWALEGSGATLASPLPTSSTLLHVFMLLSTTGTRGGVGCLPGAFGPRIGSPLPHLSFDVRHHVNLNL